MSDWGGLRLQGFRFGVGGVGFRTWDLGGREFGLKVRLLALRLGEVQNLVEFRVVWIELRATRFVFVVQPKT